MNSELTEDFLEGFSRLPNRVRELARKNYSIWKSNSNHPGLDFKRVGKNSPIYSVRIGIGWRALGLLQHQTILWFWVGSHAEYDRLLKQI